MASDLSSAMLILPGILPILRGLWCLALPRNISKADDGQDIGCRAGRLSSVRIINVGG